jgi:AraC-like DNA-binding protein
MKDDANQRANVPQYVEYPSPPELRGYIECFWSRVSPDGASDYYDSHLVLPDGCIDIVFNCSDLASKEGSTLPAAKSDLSLVVGTMTRPLAVSTTGRVHFIGVRFKPGKAHQFLGVSAHEVTDISVGLEDIWGREGGFLKESILDLSLPSRQIAHLERDLSSRALRLDIWDRNLERLLKFIEDKHGAVSVESLASLAGISRQHLARKFDHYIGVSPKVFCRIVRFRDMLALRRERTLDWTSLALELGYFDQAHMIRDFREFTGTSPMKFFSPV